MGCGEAFEGVAVGADMYHVQGVRAFIGPYCNAGIHFNFFYIYKNHFLKTLKHFIIHVKIE